MRYKSIQFGFSVLMFSILIIPSLHAQTRLYPGSQIRDKKAYTEQVLRAVAERILESTTYRFVDESGKKYESTKDVPLTTVLHLESQYNDWHYTNGVLNLGFLELADHLKEQKYQEFVLKNFDFVFNQSHIDYFRQYYDRELKKGWIEVRKVPWHMFFRMTRLDDCSAIAASLLEAMKINPKEIYMDYINQVATHIMNQEPRFNDGTIARLWPHEKTLWADDLFMSVVFLARMGAYTGNDLYLDDAIKQVIQFTDYLWSGEKQLYFHCYHGDTDQLGVAHWARANGWVMMAQTELLSVLPADHPKRSELIEIFRRQADGIARYQSESGLWHQLLDKEDSYLETSSTAMFTFSLARGVNRGWLPQDFAYVAEMGWRGVLSKIDAQASVSDICVGTGIMPSLVFYYKRPAVKNIPMGEGPVLRAGVEILKMTPYYEAPAYTKYDRILSTEKSSQ
ncbi:glycoside hydrolase family 88 protein [bacterium]|nr:glycoside hydrolase family 88 protein [bacterium]